MRVPYSWLKEYLQTAQELTDLSHLLTMGGLEVEEVRQWTAEDGGASDQLLMTSVTPNRGDLLSMVGIARQAGALSGSGFNDPVPTFGEVEDPVVDTKMATLDPLIVEIADPVGCPRYSALLIEGVEVGPSPDWLRYSLEAAGIRSINNVVDCTNFVVWELGQPLHAFDFKLIKDGHIIVRRAEQGERLLLLDDTWQTLGPEDVVISDPMGAVALAGIMGGTDTQMREVTATVLLESAHFDPMTIRKTSLRLGISSEASYRFERHVDPNLTLPALARAAKLIIETAGGEIAQQAIDVKTTDFETWTVSMRPERCNNVLGTDLGVGTMADYLQRLGFHTEEESAQLAAEVPTFRPDIQREIDLIEDVAIIYGYERIGLTVPGNLTTSGRLTETQRLRRRAGELLRECGLSENLSFSMTSLADLDHCCFPRPDCGLATLSNPASAQLDALRCTLLPSMLEAAASNTRQRVYDVALYEIGMVFYPRQDQSRPTERQHIAAIMLGSLLSARWNLPAEHVEVDFYYIKGIIEQLCQGLGVSGLNFARHKHPTFHPGKCTQVLLGNETIGLVGEIAPEVCEAYDLPLAAYAFELDLDIILQEATLHRAYQPLPRFPSVQRDVAVVVPDNDDFTASRLAEEIRQACGEFVQSISPFDIYTDPEHFGAGRKSIAFRLVFRADDRTLTDDEVDVAMAKVHRYLQEEIGAEVRK